MYASGFFWRQNLAAIDLDVRLLAVQLAAKQVDVNCSGLGELDDEICAVRFFRWVRGQLACVVDLRYFVLALLGCCFSAAGWRCPATTADSTWTTGSLWVALHYAFRLLMEVLEECRVELSMWPDFVCPRGSDDVFCFPMSGVLFQEVLWVLLGVVVLHYGDMLLGPVRAGCVVMVFGLSVTAAWRLFPSWCQRVVTLECVVFPDLVVCVQDPEGFGLSALDLVEPVAESPVVRLVTVLLVDSTQVLLFLVGCQVLRLKNKVIPLFCVVCGDALVGVSTAGSWFSCWRLKKSTSRDVDVDLFREECLCAIEPARFQFSQCAPEGAAHYNTGSYVLTECGSVGSLRVSWSFVTPCWLCLADVSSTLLLYSLYSYFSVVSELYVLIMLVV
ncbi:hypothetical protein Taro_034772, partial [Colocasia esculenta]|nr:hypothetical protein [Colocasia esculenta]